MHAESDLFEVETRVKAVHQKKKKLEYKHPSMIMTAIPMIELEGRNAIKVKKRTVRMKGHVQRKVFENCKV